MQEMAHFPWVSCTFPAQEIADMGGGEGNMRRIVCCGREQPNPPAEGLSRAVGASCVGFLAVFPD
jgi:hypothetical protein